MIKQLLSIGVLAAASTLTSHAALTWIGTNNTFFQEANWIDNVGATPAGGTINGDTDISASTGGMIIFDSSGGGTSSTGVGGDIRLGDGNDLQIGDGLSLVTTATNGISNQKVLGGTTANASMLGASSANFQFTVGMDWSLGEVSSLTLRGGTNPLNNSTINLLDAGSTIHFTDETVAAFTTEHLSKISVNGVAAVIGTNINVVSDGGSGSIVTVVPEPSSAALIGLGGLALILRRRK